MPESITNWEAVIGLEIHAQIDTATKQFCRCPVKFTNDLADANKYVCPICLGHPGVLPVLNRKSVELALRLAAAANADIATKSVFARKNYFYPDLPKGYQISQYEIPLAEGGALPFYHAENGMPEPITKSARFTRMHLEEDTGKSYHLSDGSSIVDFNRSGIPLLEIVTKPDFRSPAEAVSYLEEIRLTLIYLGISGANMELGQMRCEPNVSVRPIGEIALRPKTEIKNLNSFATLTKAVNYEIERQIHVWKTGGEVLPQTMRWDDAASGFDGRKGATVAMRTKETADDYRYFDEPDLPPLALTAEMKNAAAEFSNRTAYALRTRLKEEDRLSEYDSRNIATIPENLHWYAELMPEVGDAKLTANWVLGEISRWRSELPGGLKVTAESAAKIICAAKDGEINFGQAKVVFEKAAKGEADALALIEKAIEESRASAGGLIVKIKEAIAENPSAVSDYRAGKQAAIMVLVGQVMKKTKGSADAVEVRKILEELLK